MADTATTALSAMTTPVDTDILPVVDDPGGTPASQKLTFANLKTFVRTGLGANTSSVELGAPNLTTSTLGVTATASATPHTKGTPVELVASTAFDVQTVEVIVRGVAVAATNTAMLLDIVTGASLNVVLIPDLMVGWTLSSSGITYRWTFPVAIAAGTRVGAQIQGAVVSDTCEVAVRLHSAGTHSAAGTTVTALGVSQATSNGTLATTAGSANTKTGYDTLIASTAATYRFLVVSLGIGTSSATAGDGLLDIAIGAAASETVLIPDIPFGITSSEDIRYGGSPFYTLNIASASRLSFRYQASSAIVSCKPTVGLYGVV